MALIANDPGRQFGVSCTPSGGGTSMQLRVFGRTGMQLSVLGFGCGAVGGLMVRGELRDMLTAWRDAIGVESEHRLTLADVIEMAAKTVAGFNSNDPDYPELFAAVQAAAYAVTGKRGQQAD